MKNVTLSADEHLIEQARQVARSRNTTLNQAFRDWLTDFTSQQTTVREFEAFMKDMAKSGVTPGQKFTRDEMNER